MAASQIDKSCNELAIVSSVKQVVEWIEGDISKEFKDVSEDEFQSSFAKLMKTNFFKLKVRPSFDKYFDKDDNFTLSYVRTYINYGLPLEMEGTRYKNTTDNNLMQLEYIKDFSRMVKKLHEEKFGDGSGDKPLKSVVLTITLLIEEFESLLLNDFLFSVFSVMFVFFYLTVHLRSCFLSGIGTLLILFSFPFTMIIVAGIFRVSYFGTL